MRTNFCLAVSAASALVLSGASLAHASAIVDLTGSDSNMGALNLSTPGSYTLWSLLGGSTSTTTTTSAAGTTINYGDISTFTPTGDNSKNAILRDYVVVTTASGQQSLISLGEIDPQFAGSTASNSYVLSSNGSTVSLDLLGAGASGRDLSDVVHIGLLAVGALPGPINPTPESTAVDLSGNVSAPGSYTLSKLQSDFAPVTETVNGDTYTGVPLWTFIDPSDSDILDQYVVTAATDGYEVVLSLAELDPALGGNPGDLMPYADTNGNFPSDSVARTILPGDQPFAHGRWESDLDEVDVQAVPEPGSFGLLLAGLALLPFGRRRLRRASV